MKFEYKIRNVQRVTKALEKAGNGVIEETVQAVQVGTLAVHNRAIKLLQDNTDGTPAKRYNPNRNVFISNPGDPPNTDTGRAVKSIQFEFRDGGKTGLVGTNLKYLVALEYGTKKMAARPWLSTAYFREEKNIRKLFRDAIKKAVARGTK